MAIRGTTVLPLVMGAALFGVYGAGHQASAGGEPPAHSVAPEKLEIRVDGKKLSIGGKQYALPAARQGLVTQLGKPSRVLEKVNTLLVWDELGLVAYERPDNRLITQLTVALGNMEKYDFWPRQLFWGQTHPRRHRRDSGDNSRVDKPGEERISSDPQPYTAVPVEY